jgi:hypothetical protein
MRWLIWNNALEKAFFMANEDSIPQVHPGHSRRIIASAWREYVSDSKISRRLLFKCCQPAVGIISSQHVTIRHDEYLKIAENTPRFVNSFVAVVLPYVIDLEGRTLDDVTEKLPYVSEIASVGPHCSDVGILEEKQVPAQNIELQIGSVADCVLLPNALPVP